jgi:hypothetical protein
MMASRRRYDDIVRLGKIASADDGLQFLGDAMLGVLAFEQGLLAARWILANQDSASIPFPADPDRLDELWKRVRGLRSNVIAHMDTWIALPEASFAIDGAGTFTIHGREVLTAPEWAEWIKVIEPWARALSESDRRSAREMERRPGRL